MKEIISLSIGEYSNNVACHFWNLNLELSKSKEFDLNNNILYNDYNQPRALIFDTSSNFKSYFSKNDKLSENEENSIYNVTKNEKYIKIILNI